MEWKDVSVHRQGATDKTPTTWQAKLAGLRVTVTRHIHYAPDAWVMTCDPWFSQRVVGNGTIEDARAAAEGLIREKALELAGATEPKVPVAPGSLDDLRVQLAAEMRDGVWFLPYFSRRVSDELVVEEMVPVDIWLERRRTAAALLGRSRQVIDMVNTNNQVSAGKRRKAWNGKMVAEEVADLHKCFEEAQ